MNMKDSYFYKFEYYDLKKINALNELVMIHN